MSKVIFGTLLALVAVCSPALAKQCCQNQGVTYTNVPLVMESYSQGFIGNGMIEERIVPFQTTFVSEMPIVAMPFFEAPAVNTFVEMPVANGMPVYWYGNAVGNCCCENVGGVYFGETTVLEGEVFYADGVSFVGETVYTDEGELITFQAPVASNVIEGEVLSVEETFTSSITPEPLQENEAVIEESDGFINDGSAIEDAEEETTVDSEAVADDSKEDEAKTDEEEESDEAKSDEEEETDEAKTDDEEETDEEDSLGDE